MAPRTYLTPWPVGTKFRLMVNPATTAPIDPEEALVFVVYKYSTERMYFYAPELGERKGCRMMYRGAVGLARLDGVLVEVPDAPAP